MLAALTIVPFGLGAGLALASLASDLRRLPAIAHQLRREMEFHYALR